MITNSREPDLTRRKAFASMSAMAVGLIAMPTAVHLVLEESFPAETVIDKPAAFRSIEAEPFLVSF